MQAQNLKTKEAGAWKYMHMVSADEMNRRNDAPNYFQATDPPSSPVQSIAEFEPMAGTLIRYPFIIPETLITAIGKSDTIYTIVKNETEEQTVRDIYSKNLIPPQHCKFIRAASNSGWARDYGPWFVAGPYSVGITDCTYNRPRPDDDKIPQAIASQYGFPYFSMNVVHTGGNYMTDGYGVAVSTPIVYSESMENGVTNEQVARQMKDYLGIHTYRVMKDPNNTYIQHVDCWAKFLDVDKIMLRSVSENHPQYDEIEAVNDYFRNQKSSWGNNYEVFRIYTPNDEPYTNSYILNRQVFVPVTGGEWDDEALQSYRDAMPGYEISGYRGDWLPTDALHCRVHEMADKQMIRIRHIPVRRLHDSQTQPTVNATITAYSGKPLHTDSVQVYFRVGSGQWQSGKMTAGEHNHYSFPFPAIEPGETVQYYVRAVDQTGKQATVPLTGKDAPYSFSVTTGSTQAPVPAYVPEIKVYPNPVADWLNIDLNRQAVSEKTTIGVYAASGQKVKQIVSSGIRIIKIDMRHFKPGVYYFVITDKNKTLNLRIIRKHI